MRRSVAFFAVGCGATILICTGFAFAKLCAQAKETSETVPSLVVACSVDKPIVVTGGTVVLRAWAMSSSERAPEFIWNAEAGEISGEGREVQWELIGVPASSRPEATVKVRVSPTSSASCSLQVIVAEKEKGGKQTGRSFLVKGKNEDEGYGLYSYLLLGSRPGASTRDRYLKAIEAYQGRMVEVAKLEDYFLRSKLNVAYLPIELDPQSEPSATWLLDHYDYARAQTLLSVLPGNLREGPYIVSTLKPLSSNTPASQYLFQDLSAVPASDSDLISWWVREFLNQAAQERYWEPKTAEHLALKIRTTIAVLGLALPDVQKGLENWISWKAGH